MANQPWNSNRHRRRHKLTGSSPTNGGSQDHCMAVYLLEKISNHERFFRRKS